MIIIWNKGPAIVTSISSNKGLLILSLNTVTPLNGYMYILSIFQLNNLATNKWPNSWKIIIVKYIIIFLKKPNNKETIMNI